MIQYQKRLMKYLLLLFTIHFYCISAIGQDIKERRQSLETQLTELQAQEKELLAQLESIKLEQIQVDLHQNGLPALKEGETLIEHSAMSLVYSEKHEQAQWVAHIITPDIITSNLGRTNDFRVDKKISTGTAVEEDYFLKKKKADGEYEYDGFGWDRGHLAPSADFRWSQKAMSESYLYSNMSPQVAEFNRGKWAELEGSLRGYLFRNPNTQLYVVTGPILKDGLPVVERSINKVTIPKLYFKVVIDLKNKKAVGFIMPNKSINYPISSFAISIDKVEEETGLDFFTNLPDDIENELEAMTEFKSWLPEQQQSDIEPIFPPSLPANHFNTIQAKQYIGNSKTVHICGTVVSARASRKGNILINLDQHYPNQLFTIFIKKENIINFSYDPEKELMGQQICVRGTVSSFSNAPAMFINKGEDLQLMDKGLKE